MVVFLFSPAFKINLLYKKKNAKICCLHYYGESFIGQPQSLYHNENIYIYVPYKKRNALPHLPKCFWIADVNKRIIREKTIEEDREINFFASEWFMFFICKNFLVLKSPCRLYGFRKHVSHAAEEWDTRFPDGRCSKPEEKRSEFIFLFTSELWAFFYPPLKSKQFLFFIRKKKNIEITKI